MHIADFRQSALPMPIADFRQSALPMPIADFRQSALPCPMLTSDRVHCLACWSLALILMMMSTDAEAVIAGYIIHMADCLFITDAYKSTGRR